jgi:hypothetical protein
MIGGVLAAFVVVAATIFLGNWFRESFSFADSGSLERAINLQPTRCTFATETLGGTTKGTILTRDGLMRFDMKNDLGGEITEWGIEIDMNDPSRIMSRSDLNEPYTALTDYPDLRVRVIDDLQKIMKSERLRCSPWWSGSGFHFALEGHL